MCRAVHNIFHLGEGDNVISLAEVENIVALQLFTQGRSGGMVPQEMLFILGVVTHSGAL